MIQPLKSSKITWLLYWVDLEEPIPSVDGFFLPTLVIVCDASGIPLAPPEVMEELDQARVENFLLKLFDSATPPERLTVCASEDWEEDAWKSFAQEQSIEIRFQRFDKQGPEELRALARSVVLRFTRQPADAVSPAEVSLGLVRTALRTRSRNKKLLLLRKAVERDPDCSFARVELADLDFHQGNWKACLSAYEEVISREYHRTGDKSAQWWTDRSTRPYLRALYGRGMTLWHQGRHLESAAQFEALLALSPLDNQGVRFYIPLLYLLAEENEEALQWFERYEKRYAGDYPEPSFLFGWAFSLSLNGRETEARLKYREAVLRNIYIAPMLIEETEPPRMIWLPNDRAEPSYAAEFIDSYAVLWDREAGALRILREVWHEMLPHVQKLILHREEMLDFQDQRFDPGYKEKWQKHVAEEERISDPKNL
jgi:tetratricopeptide (TPR) repeat protein